MQCCFSSTNGFGGHLGAAEQTTTTKTRYKVDIGNFLAGLPGKHYIFITKLI